MPVESCLGLKKNASFRMPPKAPAGITNYGGDDVAVDSD